MSNNTYGATYSGSSLETALYKPHVFTSHNWAEELKVGSLSGKDANRTTSAQGGSESRYYSRSSLTDPAAQETRQKLMTLQASNQIELQTALHAQGWLDKLRKIATKNQMWWREPLVNVGIEQEVVFEWWHGAKKLTVYLLYNDAEYIKVWGADMDNEMQEGRAQSLDDLALLWKWLAL